MTDVTTTAPTGQRPTFLTVLCILSWISAVWSFLSSAMSIATKEKALDALRQSKESLEIQSGNESLSFMEGFMNNSLASIQDTIDHFMLINTSNLTLYAAQIVAVFFMFKLQKKGFWLYTFVQILLLIMPFIYMTTNSVMLLGSGFTLLISGAFVAMYATNLKHMN